MVIRGNDENVSKIVGTVCRGVVLLVLAVILAGTASAQVCTPPPPGLVAWWPGDGNYNDIVGNNDGTQIGTVPFVQGEVRQAFAFNGANGVVVPNSSAIDITADLTNRGVDQAGEQ